MYSALHKINNIINIIITLSVESFIREMPTLSRITTETL